MTDMRNIPTRLSRRRLLTGGASVAAIIALAGCDQEESPATPQSPVPGQGPMRASNLALQYFWQALNNAAQTLGAVGPVRFTSCDTSNKQQCLDALLAEAGISASHRNHDIISEIYTLGISSAWGSPSLARMENLRDLAEPVLESAYNRALGECERNMPTCDIDITTRFNAPGSPGGAPTWVDAWWDFSSP